MLRCWGEVKWTDIMTDSLVDPGALETLCENFRDSPDILGLVLNDFFESVDRLHTRINIALTTGDAEDMARAAHSLKSNCATVGALAMADVMREIERIGNEGELAGCDVLLTRSSDLYTTVRPQLKALLHDLSGIDA